ncbi:MAG: hypothetical protein LIQ31_05130 [Planctomycetes bacterium]|nr:hypothetical protein [Planctomycetota bacterium]
MIQGMGSAGISGAQYYANTSRNAISRATAGSGSSNPDIVAISQAARALSEKVSGMTVQQPSTYTTIVDQTVPKVAGASLHRYADLGLGEGETNLTAMNFSRKVLGGKVESILKSAGIKLGKDERVSMSVGSDNKIKVAGIKDKKKAAAIEEALNEDKKLGRDLRNHVAVGRVTQNAKKQEEYVEFLKDNGMEVPDDIDDLFTHSGIRAFIIDEYLQKETGSGLEGLGLSVDADGNETLTGASQNLMQLLTEDTQLDSTLKSMIRDGKTDTSFSVSFEYANGAISDPTSIDMANNKIKSIRESIMGYWDKETQTMVPGAIDNARTTIDTYGGGFNEDPALMEALSRGFSIKVDRSGKFEIVGDHLDAGAKRMLTNIVQKALDGWAEDKSRTALDGLGGVRIANFADVADAFIEEHRFEHGDVDENAHEVIINFAGGADSTKVVSDAADKAQDEKNKQLAGELGDSLRTMLGDKGIDAQNLTMEINENGRIIVQGDADQKDIQKAQELIDAFVKDTREAGGPGQANGKDEDDVNSADINPNADNERLEMHFKNKKKDDDYTPDGWAKSDVVTTSDDEKPVLETEEEERLRNLFFSKGQRHEKTVENFAKTLPGLFPDQNIYNGTVKGGVSNIKAPRFASDEAAGPGGWRFNVTGASEAGALYRELMNGMQFHDPMKTAKYEM